MLGVYAELDSRVNGTKDAMEAALTAAGLTHELRGLPRRRPRLLQRHRGPLRRRRRRPLAYAATIDWFGRYLA